MITFKKWLENYGGSANFPSGVEDEGDGGDALNNKMIKPGAFNTYGDDLPINKKQSSETPFAVFVLAPVKGGYAATTRPLDTGEAGKIGLPGGKVDKNEDPVSAAERESKEEGWSLVVDREPFSKQIVAGRLLWWFRGKNAEMLFDYKEKRRLKPVVATKEQVINSGYGNDNLGL